MKDGMDIESDRIGPNGDYVLEGLFADEVELVLSSWSGDLWYGSLGLGGEA